MEQRSVTPLRQDDKGKISFDRELVSKIKDKSRDEEVVSILKESNISNSSDSSGNTLLHIAAQYDNAAVMQHLIRSGSNIDVQNNSGKTPLILAIENDCQNSTTVLLEANASIFIADSTGKNALHYFLNAKWFGVLYLAWKFLKNVESQCLNDSKVIATKLLEAEWPLCLLENTEVFDKMLELGCRVDAREPVANRTALHEAVLASDVERVKLLLHYRADPNAMDKFDRAPLYYVYDRENKHTEERPKIVKLLVGKGASAVTSSSDSSYSQVEPVLRYGNGEAIRILLQANLDLTRTYENDSTAVHILAGNPNPDAFEALRDHSFEVDSRNAFADTPLMIAASFGNSRAVQLLLERGADVHAVDVDDCLPLHKCVEKFSPELESQYKQCVQLLLEHGADVQRTSYIFRDPSTVFDVVREKRTYAVGELLVANLALQEARGTTIEWSIYGRKILSDATFKSYYDFCKQELAIKFCKSTTLLDLLSVSDAKFESCARDQQLVSSVEHLSDEWKGKLYYYDTILQRRYAKAVHTLKLKEEAAARICEIMKTEYCRFPIIADKIISYLEEQDMNNLLQVSL